MKNMTLYSILAFTLLVLIRPTFADSPPICTKSNDPVDSSSLPCGFPNIHAGPYAGSINIKKDRPTMSFKVVNEGELPVNIGFSYADNCLVPTPNDTPKLTEDFFYIKPGQTRLVTVYSNCTYELVQRDWPKLVNPFGLIEVSVLTWGGADWSKIKVTLDNE